MEQDFKISGTLNGRIVISDDCDIHEIFKVSNAELLDLSHGDGFYEAVFSQENTMVNVGLQNVLKSGWTQLTTPALIDYIGVSDDTDAVTVATTKFDAGSDSNVTIEQLENVSITNQTVTGNAVFDNTNANFAYNKIGLLSTATDAGTGLLDIVSIAIDFTSATSWSARLGIDVLLT